MLYNEMKRNASGYYDETPYKSVLCNPEAGDVLESGMNKVYLILKNHGKFSTALALFPSLNQTSNTTYEIAVDESGCNHKYYTNPAMIQYVFNDIFMNRAGALEQDDFLGLMETVGENLGVTIKVSKQTVDNTNEVDSLKSERKALMQELDVKNKQLIRLEEKLKEVSGYALYKQMYYELLDRLIMKGGV